MLKNSILQKLAANHQNTTRPLNLGVYYKNTLIALCHALEDFILDSESQPMMIAAFQRGKWYLEEAERYEDLAKKSQHVAIMAASGFSEKDMITWHQNFEKMEPNEHQKFLILPKTSRWRKRFGGSPKKG